MKTKFILLLIFLSILNSSFCFTVKAEGNSELQNPVQQGQEVPVNTITLEESSKTIEIEKTITIKAAVSPDNAANKGLIWSSSNDKVATVDSNGSITALKQGVALITVKNVDGTKEAVCVITVVGHKGWNSENGKWYYYDYETNTKKTGWLSYNGYWYYLNPSGEMKTGWLLDNGTWYYLYNSGEMAINPGGLSSSTDYCIIVDSKNQAVNIFSGYANHWSFIKTMTCSTGAAETPTIKGLFTVQGRGYMFRAGSNTICKYYTGFSGNYLFHTILLDNDGNVQDPTLGVPASHGCVRLAIEDAMYIYYNIPYGTTVWSM